MSLPADPLVVDRIHAWRGDRHVLKGVSLTVRAGELVHVHGANGAGKTTLLRVITGLMRPEQGSVSWCGTTIEREPARYLAFRTGASGAKNAAPAASTCLRFMRFAC